MKVFFQKCVVHTNVFMSLILLNILSVLGDAYNLSGGVLDSSFLYGTLQLQLVKILSNKDLSTRIT